MVNTCCPKAAIISTSIININCTINSSTTTTVLLIEAPSYYFDRATAGNELMTLLLQQYGGSTVVVVHQCLLYINKCCQYSEWFVCTAWREHSTMLSFSESDDMVFIYSSPLLLIKGVCIFFVQGRVSRWTKQAISPSQRASSVRTHAFHSLRKPGKKRPTGKEA